MPPAFRRFPCSAYDAAGNLTFINYPSSPDITPQYDPLGRLFSTLPHEFSAYRGVLTFANGSRIIAGHFQNEKDIDAVLGLEYDVIGIEEATTLSSRKYTDISTFCPSSRLLPVQLPDRRSLGEGGSTLDYFDETRAQGWKGSSMGMGGRSGAGKERSAEGFPFAAGLGREAPKFFSMLAGPGLQKSWRVEGGRKAVESSELRVESAAADKLRSLGSTLSAYQLSTLNSQLLQVATRAWAVAVRKLRGL